MSLKQLRAELIAKRKVFGFDTPAGYRCSNLDQQLEVHPDTKGDARINLEASIRLQMRDLARFAS